jgi:hypothetical protein
MHQFYRVFNVTRNVFCSEHARSFNKALYPLAYYQREFKHFKYELKPCPYNYTGSEPLD